MNRKKLTIKFNLKFNTEFTADQVKGICIRFNFTTGKINKSLNLEKKHIDFLKINCHLARKLLTEKFNKKFTTNFNHKQITAACSRHKLNNRDPRPRLNYTKEQIQFLKQRKTMPRRKLTEKFNKRFNTDMKLDNIKSTCTRLGLLTGRTGFFPKDHKPWNTGTKGICKKNTGSFQPGPRPELRYPIGSERFCHKDKCIMIKVADPNKWRVKSRVIYEKNYGPIPPGMLVHIKDCNPLNIEPENLMLITMAMNVRLNQNGYRKAAPEHKKTIWMISELQTKISERIKIEN